MKKAKKLTPVNSMLTKTRSIPLIFILLMCMLCAAMYWLNKFIFYTPYNASGIYNIFSVLLLITLVINLLYCFIYCDTYRPFVIHLILFVVLVLINIIMTCTMLHSYQYASLAGTIEKTEFKSDMSVADLTKLPIVDKSLAENLADKKLGELSAIGSQMKVGDLTLQKVKDTLYYVAPLEFRGYLEWRSNSGISPGYVMVNAQVLDDVKIVTSLNGADIKLKYLPSSYWGANLDRYAFSKVSDKFLTDYTFEIDDDGMPYWVVTESTNQYTFYGSKTTGCLVIDAQTGDSNEYTLDTTPDWVDRVQDISILNHNLNYYGKYSGGYLNSWSKKNLTKTTEKYSVIYNNGKCYYYVGVTSTSSDQSLIGFYLIDTRTGDVKMYETAGAIESAAESSAQGAVQQYGYTSSTALLVNLQNQPTYFMTLKDAKGLVKNYAFVNVNKYSIVGHGDTLKDAYTDYISHLSQAGNGDLEQSVGEKTTLEGTVTRIGMTMTNNSIIYNIKLDSDKRVFSVPDSYANIELTRVGDKVKLGFIGSGTDVNINEFVNEAPDLN